MPGHHHSVWQRLAAACKGAASRPRPQLGHGLPVASHDINASHDNLNMAAPPQHVPLLLPRRCRLFHNGVCRPSLPGRMSALQCTWHSEQTDCRAAVRDHDQLQSDCPLRPSAYPPMHRPMRQSLASSGTESRSSGSGQTATRKQLTRSGKRKRGRQLRRGRLNRNARRRRRRGGRRLSRSGQPRRRRARRQSVQRPRRRQPSRHSRRSRRCRAKLRPLQPTRLWRGQALPPAPQMQQLRPGMQQLLALRSRSAPSLTGWFGAAGAGSSAPTSDWRLGAISAQPWMAQPAA